MFDAIQPKNAGNVPPNLPVSEPEDIFQDAEAAVPPPAAPPSPTIAPPPAPSSAPAAPPAAPPSSALGAGILKPKTPAYAAQEPPAGDETYRIKEPSIGKGIVLTLVSAAGLVALGGATWWIYNTYIAGRAPVVPMPVSSGETPSPAPSEDRSSDTPLPSDTSPSLNESVTDEVVDDQVLFGQPVDRDSDGLDDVREEGLLTDPDKWDTDNDGLSDGDEALGWKTDPRNIDTDGDGFSDGQEVQNGYNPNGAGKFIQPPTSTPAGE